MDEHEKLFEDQLDEMLKQMEQDKSVPKKIERKKRKNVIDYCGSSGRTINRISICDSGNSE